MHLRDISLMGLSKIILIAFLAFPLMASLLLLVLFLLGADVGTLDFRVPFGTPRGKMKIAYSQGGESAGVPMPPPQH